MKKTLEGAKLYTEELHKLTKTMLEGAIAEKASRINIEEIVERVAASSISNEEKMLVCFRIGMDVDRVSKKVAEMLGFDDVKTQLLKGEQVENFPFEDIINDLTNKKRDN